MIFVTGGTGLVGSHILLKLTQQGKKIKALKREGSDLDICQKIFTYYDANDLFKKINWINGDINDIPSLEEGMQDSEFVLHAAGLVSSRTSDIKLLKKVNIEGTKNIVNVALSKKIKKLGYISSIAALGRNSTDDIIDENYWFIATKLDGNYAISKYLAEQEVWRASQEGLDIVIINPSVILGPGDWTKGSSKVFEKIFNGLKFYTSGSTGFVDVIDVADTIIQLLESNIINERFIVNGENLKYRFVFDMIAKQFGKKKATIKITPFLKELAWRLETFLSFITDKNPLLTKENANNSMVDSSYSTKKLEKAISFKFTAIEKSIKKYCEWYLKDLR